MTQLIVLEVERSGFVESRHLVDVAVVDDAGALIARAGDPEREAAFRSCAKPIQARVCIHSGWVPHDPRSVAVACASHYGEPAHVAAVRAALAAAGLDEDVLQCPPAVPADEAAALGVSRPARVYNYCSGKHTAMIAASSISGWPLDTYRDVDHPLQVRIRELVDRLVGGARHVLVDGCGVPTLTASLAALARAFHAIDDGGPETAAMRSHPHLVAGTAQLDTDLMDVVPDLVVKSGAEGLVCVSAPGYGIALKIRDGDWPRARGPAAVLVLRELGLLDDRSVEALERHSAVPVLGGGVPVGAVRAVGTLSVGAR